MYKKNMDNESGGERGADERSKKNKKVAGGKGNVNVNGGGATAVDDVRKQIMDTIKSRKSGGSGSAADLIRRLTNPVDDDPKQPAKEIDCNENVNSSNRNNPWVCTCNQSFLPSCMLKGGLKGSMDVFKMGSGGCYKCE